MRKLSPELKLVPTNVNLPRWAWEIINAAAERELASHSQIVGRVLVNELSAFAPMGAKLPTKPDFGVVANKP